MTDYIHVEPGKPHRPAFALWGLSQNPPIQTATATGWDVPVDLYPAIPAELLEGAWVDGYRYEGAGGSLGALKVADASIPGPDSVQDVAEGVPDATRFELPAPGTTAPKASTRRTRKAVAE